MDGWITIGTKLSTDKFDKQIADLENKIDSEEKKQELLNNKTQQYQKELQGVTREVNELTKEFNNAVDKAEQLNNSVRNAPKGSYQRFELTREFDEQIEKAQELEKQLDKAEAKQNGLKNKVAQTNIQQQRSASLIDKIRGKIEQINLNRHNKELKEAEKSADSFKNKITTTIGQIGRMAMAVLGVRSAYMLLRRASSTLAQYNQQYARDLEYIQFVIAQSLAPILQKVVSLVQTLMAYINYLSQALFGVNLFANASAKAFQSMSGNASGMVKSTKEIKNNLASFDELNVLDTNKGQDAGGGVGGAVAPSMDLGSIENVEIPEWLKTIADILKPVVDFFKEINEKYGPVATGIGLVVTALAGFWILKGLKDLLFGFGKAFTGFGADFTGFFNALGRAAEAVAILWGLSEVIKAITDLITAFSESGMTLGEVAGLLGIVLGELAVAFLALMGIMTALNPSWQSIAGAAVIFAGLAVVLLSVSNLIKTFSESGMTLNDVIGIMATVLLSVVGLMAMVAILGPEMYAGLVPFLVVIGGISAILAVMALTLPTILEAVEKFITGTAPALNTVLETIAKGISVIIEAIGTALPPIIESVGDLFTSIFDGIAHIIETVGDVIIKLQDNTIKFIEELGPAINKFVDGVIEAVTKLINFLISGIEYMVNLVISGVNKIIEGINSVGEYVGITIPKVPKFELPRFTPKLARGGIVAKPTQAIIGEAGREAVMPLDNNTEWMDLLADRLAERLPSGSQDITIRFEGTMAQFVRELKPQIEVENRRAGSRLITGGAY